MCRISYSRRVLILAYTKLGVLVTFTLLFLVAISVLIINFDEVDKKEGTKIIISGVIVFFLAMSIEAVLLVLLFKGIKQRSHKICLIWFVINSIIFTISFISFLWEAFVSWPTTLIFTLVELLYDGCALKIVYDFMGEVKIVPDGDVPFQEMKEENLTV